MPFLGCGASHPIWEIPIGKTRVFCGLNMKKQPLYHNYNYKGALIYMLCMITHHFSHRNRAHSWLPRGMPPAVIPLGGPARMLVYGTQPASLSLCVRVPLLPLHYQRACGCCQKGQCMPRHRWAGQTLRGFFTSMLGVPRPVGSPRCGQAPLVLTALRASLCCRGVGRLIVVGGRGF